MHPRSENSVIAITVLDESGTEVIGFAAFGASPSSAKLPAGAASDEWPTWLSGGYESVGLGPQNAVWLSFFSANSLYEQEVADNILNAVFSTMRSAEAVVYALPALVPPFTPVAEPDVFVELKARGTGEADAGGGARVFACWSATYSPSLRVRTAKLEDHDDLVPVFNQQSQMLTQLYGDFFLAKVIGSQSRSNQVLVAEVDGKAVGLMGLTSDIDTEILAKCFELAPYDNLQRVDDAKSGGGEAGSVSGGAPGPIVPDADYVSDLVAADTEAKRAPGASLTPIFSASYRGLVSRVVSPYLSSEELKDKLWLRFGAELPDEKEGKEGKEDGGDADGTADPMADPMAMTDPMAAEAGDDQDNEGKEDEEEGESKPRAVDPAEYNKKFKSALGDALPGQLAGAVLAAAVQGLRTVKGGAAVDLEALPEAVRSRITSLVEAKGAPVTEQSFIEVCSAAATAGGVVNVNFVFALAGFAQVVAGGEGGYVETDEALKELMAAGEFVELEASASSPERPTSSQLRNLSVSTGTQAGRASVKLAVSNAVCITLYCLDAQYESMAGAFLEEAFERYPDHDYCLLTMPHGATQIPLLDDFIVARPLPTNTFSHALYLYHRTSVRNLITVRWAKYADVIALRDMIGTLRNSADVLAAARQGIATAASARAAGSQPESACFTVEYSGQFAGCVVASASDLAGGSLERLCRAYAVEDVLSLATYPAGTHANVTQFVLDPLFDNRKSFVMSEVLRLYRMGALHYRVNPGQPMLDILQPMVQVKPRSSLVPQAEASKRAFALYVATARILNEPRLAVNNRMVVVGANSASLAFIEQLLLNPGVDFRSITLIAPSGIEEANSGSTGFFPASLDYDRRALDKIAFAARVRVVEADVKRIESKKKLVVLANRSLVPYDTLVLAADLVDQTPGRLGSVSQAELDERKRRAEELRRLAEEEAEQAAAASEGGAEDEKGEGGDAETGEKKEAQAKRAAAVPSRRTNDRKNAGAGQIERRIAADVKGVVSVQRNDSMVKALKLLDRADAKSGNVLVYGSTTTAATIVRGLLNRGLKPAQIFWLGEDASSSVVSADRYKLTLWNCGNSKVESLVTRMLTQLGVNYLGVGRAMAVRYDESGLTGIHFKPSSSRRGRFPTSVTQLTEDEDSTGGYFVPCGLMLCCGRPDISRDLYRTIVDNSLVYDGRLVVNRKFCTQSPSILGTGPLCKFSRREGKSLPFECYNPNEVGVRLAETVVDELVRDDDDDGDDGDESPASFALPISVEAVYPGESRLFFAYLPSYVPSRKKSAVRAIERDQPRRYYQLTFDDSGVLQSFLYYGADPINTREMSKLLGLPFTYLNGVLKAAAGEKKPDDVVELLQGPWSQALIHDEFQRERSVINAEMGMWAQSVLAGEGKGASGPELEAVRKIIAAMEKGVSDDKTAASVVELLPLAQKKAIQARIIQFVQQNRSQLRGYSLDAPSS